MEGRHPSDELLMSYASGALEESFALVVNCHLQFCERCTAKARELEDLGAAVFAAWTDAITPDDAGFRDRTMHRFAEVIGADQSYATPIEADPGGEFIMPRPLALKSGLRRETIPWTPVAPGLTASRLFRDSESDLHFLKLEPGLVLPRTADPGDRLILVLWGDYLAEDGLVRRGDLHEIQAGTPYSFSAGLTEGVTCIVAADASAMPADGFAV